jgi:hypothetical protein
MGALEDEVKQMISHAVRRNPVALEATTTGPVNVTLEQMTQLALDKLNGVEQAVYRLAREIDESRA